MVERVAGELADPMVGTGSRNWQTDGVLARRVLAWAVDALAITVLFACAKIALLAVGLLTLGLGLPLLALLPLLPFAYVLAFLGGPGAATPGQLLAGIRLRRAIDGGRPDTGQALGWTLGLAATMLLGAVWLLFALVTVRHRTLHDLASGLVMTRDAAAPARRSPWAMPVRSGNPYA